MTQPGNPDPAAAAGPGYSGYDAQTGQPVPYGVAQPPAYPSAAQPTTYGLPPVAPTGQPVYPQQSAAGQPTYQDPAAAAPGSYPPYGTPGYPGSQPAAAPGGYPPYGTPGYPTYAGYPGLAPGYLPVVVPGSQRPATALGASVLLFVQGAFVLLGGMLTAFGSTVGDNDDDISNGQLTLLGIVTLVVGGLLIAGGVTLLSRKRTLTVWGCLGSLAVSVWWIVLIAGWHSRYDYRDDNELAVLWIPIMAAVLPIIALSMALSGSVTRWIRTP